MKYIFLHGMGQNSRSWDKTISFLPADVETECPELTEFFTAGKCTYGELYANFRGYCNSFTEPPHICGLSLGAVLALNYAVELPQRVNSLTLVAPQYDMPKFLLKVQNILFRFMPQRQFERIGFTKSDFISLTNSMADIDFRESLADVSCRVTVLCGEKDKVNRKASKAIAELLPNAEFKMISNAGHEVNIDNPQALAEAIKSRQVKR